MLLDQSLTFLMSSLIRPNGSGRRQPMEIEGCAGVITRSGALLTARSSRSTTPYMQNTSWEPPGKTSAPSSAPGTRQRWRLHTHRCVTSTGCSPGMKTQYGSVTVMPFTGRSPVRPPGRSHTTTRMAGFSMAQETQAVAGAPTWKASRTTSERWTFLCQRTSSSSS